LQKHNQPYLIPVQPTPESKPCTTFDSKTLSFDEMYLTKLTVKQILSVLPVMVPLQLQMRRSAKSMMGNFNLRDQKPIPHFLPN
jgi:hypothetical protein